MQEKAWSTGGLKKLINTIIDKNVICYKKAKNIVIDTKNIGTVGFSFEPVRVGKVFIINKTQKWVAFLTPILLENDSYTYKLYNIDYNIFINLNSISILGVNVIDTLVFNINNVDNTVVLTTDYFPYNANDNIEIIYENAVYGIYKDT